MTTKRISEGGVGPEDAGTLFEYEAATPEDSGGTAPYPQHYDKETPNDRT